MKRCFDAMKPVAVRVINSGLAFTVRTSVILSIPRISRFYQLKINRRRVRIGFLDGDAHYVEVCVIALRKVDNVDVKINEMVNAQASFSLDTKSLHHESRPSSNTLLDCN